MSVAEHRVGVAETDDVETVINLVAGMFRDLGSPDEPDGWRQDVRRALASRLGSDVAAFVATDGGVPVAVAVGVIDRRLPSPRRPTGDIGYVEWLATAPNHRRQGHAGRALKALLDWFDEHDLAAVDVHASAVAQPLYESLGFRAPIAVALRHRRELSAEHEGSLG